jgi:hypothetical protein
VCEVGEDVGGFFNINSVLNINGGRWRGCCLKNINRRRNDSERDDEATIQTCIDSHKSKVFVNNINGTIESSHLSDDGFKPSFIRSYQDHQIHLTGNNLLLPDTAPIIDIVSDPRGRLAASVIGGSYEWIKRNPYSTGYGEVFSDMTDKEVAYISNRMVITQLERKL